MHTPSHIFEAVKTGSYINLGLALLVVVLAGIGVLWLKRRKLNYINRTRIRLVELLLYFVLLIAGGTAIFTGVQLNRLQPIKIYEDRLETAYGTVAITDLAKVQLYQDEQRSFVSPDIEVNTALLLYIEEEDGDAYVFANENYDVRAIVNILRPMMDQKN